MVVNASQVVRWLEATGTADAWSVYDRATLKQLAEWAPLARAWEEGAKCKEDK